MTDDIEVLQDWIRGCLIIAAICTTAVPVLYAFLPWWTSRIGKLLMMKAIAFALAMDVTLLFNFWVPESIRVIFWVNTIVLTLIAASTGLFAQQIFSRVVKQWRERKKEEIYEESGL